MRSTFAISVLFLLFSTALTLPLSPHSASKPSSHVERRWDPLSLLRRAPSPEDAVDNPIKKRPNYQPTKGLKVVALNKNPIVASIWGRSESVVRSLVRRIESRSSQTGASPSDTVTTDCGPNGCVVVPPAGAEMSTASDDSLSAPAPPETKDDFFQKSANSKPGSNVLWGWRAQTANYATSRHYGG
ncbi:MAG: hypothetical protein L6R40_004625 [Gallowayella cf. fulva]|nr:MAG: hypothetical protein L6R40_004625 [Xanthomendoza cf. fulva]